MASDRQIQANRRNARNSTGPRSTSGRKRASQNAFRRGQTLRSRCAEDKIKIELARDAAEAELELARVRRVKVALIERVTALGRFDVPKIFQSPKDEVAWIFQYYFKSTLWEGRPKFAVDPLPAMPSQEPQRTAEAVRRILPEVIKLHRYESRAVMRRDRAIRAIALRSKIHDTI
jgi:hypothetical protein